MHMQCQTAPRLAGSYIRLVLYLFSTSQGSMAHCQELLSWRLFRQDLEG
jgi:hypothetical protein